LLVVVRVSEAKDLQSSERLRKSDHGLFHENSFTLAARAAGVFSFPNPELSNRRWVNCCKIGDQLPCSSFHSLERFIMKLARCLGYASFASATLLLAAGPAGLAADTPKAKLEAKQELRKKLQAAKKAEELKKETEAKKAAESAKPVPVAPVVPAEKPQAAKAVSPAAKDPALMAKMIDAGINAKITEAKSVSSPICSDAEFLRRAYLDIVGVIPSGDKAKEFIDSTDPAKRSKLIDELLANPLYGRHQSDLWIPKLYPKDSANRFITKEPLAKWFEEQFNANTPWNQFVTNLVTATGSIDKNPEVMYFLANRSVDKLTDTVTQHFLGIQLQCAQCHNHPFTGWKQTEYWGMATFFSKVMAQAPRNANKGGDNTQLGVREGPTATKAKDFFPESAKTVPAKFLGAEAPKLNSSEPYRPALAAWMTSAENPYFAKAMVNRTWHQFFGSGFVNPIDDMHDENPASHPELLADLSHAFASGGFDVKNLIRGICLSQTYQRSSKPTAGNERAEDLFVKMTVKVMIPEQLYDSIKLASGPTPAEMNKDKRAAAGAKGGPVTDRDRFVQFFLAGADEASTTDYEAGIPQALKLMNSKMSAPASLKTMAKSGTKTSDMLDTMFLATLSRRPSANEVKQLTEYVSKSSTPTEAYSDVFWALLNSSEFTMVR